MHSYCTASIQLSYQPGGSIKAIINKTHYGHTCSLGHIPLPQHIRSELATQIATGINFDIILDKVRNNVNGDHLERVHLLTKKDLNNIEQAFHLQGHQRHKDDATSIDLWIEELTQQGGDIPILFFKQGHKETTIGSNIGLGIHDFALVIQTKIQTEMLENCGTERIKGAMTKCVR